MGGCSTRNHYEERRTESDEVPEPIVLKEKNFAFVHYTGTKTSYRGLEDALSGIPDYEVSEISLFQSSNPENMKRKNVLKLIGIDPISGKARASLLIEKFKKDVVIQFGNLKVIDLILKSENSQFLFKKDFNKKNSHIKCSDIVQLLHDMNEETKGAPVEKNSVITYIKTVLR